MTLDRLMGDRRRRLRTLLLALLGLLVLITAWSSFHTVAADGKAVVKRFGSVIDVRDPGLHFKLPFGIETAQFVPTERVLKEEFGFRTVSPGQRTRYAKTDAMQRESLMLTGDLNVIDVEWVVQYRVSDPTQYLHEVRDQTSTVRDIAESVMRQVVGNRLGSDVLTVGRVAIAAAVREAMQEILDSYSMGVHVSGVELQDVTPPEEVKQAFNEVNESRQQKEQLINVAEKERNQVLPRARGEADQTIAEAEAYATERKNVARGESARFTAILEHYRAAEELTRRRLFLETFDEVAADLGGLYIIDGSAANTVPLLGLGHMGLPQLRTEKSTDEGDQQ